MNFIELLAGGLIKDDHEVKLWIYANGDRTVRKGKWYEDEILEYKRYEVSNITYDLLPNGSEQWLVQLLPPYDAKVLYGIGEERSDQ